MLQISFWYSMFKSISSSLLALVITTELFCYPVLAVIELNPDDEVLPRFANKWPGSNPDSRSFRYSETTRIEPRFSLGQAKPSFRSSFRDEMDVSVEEDRRDEQNEDNVWDPLGEEREGPPLRPRLITEYDIDTHPDYIASLSNKAASNEDPPLRQRLITEYDIETHPDYIASLSHEDVTENNLRPFSSSEKTEDDDLSYVFPLREERNGPPLRKRLITEYDIHTQSDYIASLSDQEEQHNVPNYVSSSDEEEEDYWNDNSVAPLWKEPPAGQPLRKRLITEYDIDTDSDYIASLSDHKDEYWW